MMLLEKFEENYKKKTLQTFIQQEPWYLQLGKLVYRAYSFRIFGLWAYA